MSVTVRHHDHTQDDPCTGGCGIVHATDGERVDIYEARMGGGYMGYRIAKIDDLDCEDVPDNTNEPDEPDSEHVCKVRLLAAQQRTTGSQSVSALLASVPRIPQTDLLYYCDGCGEYSSATLTGHWNMADLDPARPVLGGPDPA